ncbi:MULTISPECIES: hypothetical protein [unclassified Moraxella]|uniref:hypothetical protein n=1 Tax=unclassified Moraxella TaxID=2685852 RepID=UPI003AF4B916
MKLLHLTPITQSHNSDAMLTPPVKAIANEFEALTDSNLIGLDKSTVKLKLLRLNLEFVEFVHWLMIPQLHKNLYFDKQICRVVNNLNQM